LALSERRGLGKATSRRRFSGRSFRRQGRTVYVLLCLLPSCQVVRMPQNSKPRRSRAPRLRSKCPHPDCKGKTAFVVSSSFLPIALWDLRESRDRKLITSPLYLCRISKGTLIQRTRRLSILEISASFATWQHRTE
jgi:hypothetical protein